MLGTKKLTLDRVLMRVGFTWLNRWSKIWPCVPTTSSSHEFFYFYVGILVTAFL